MCKFYIETIRDAPHDLRVILLEISGLKATLETLDFLIHIDSNFVSKVIENLDSGDGPLAACRQSLSELEKLFPADHLRQDNQQPRIKRRKLQQVTQTLAVLAWPLKASKAQILLADIQRHKATISLALSTESRYVAFDIG